nr:glycosyltransferase family 2 protein [Shewanella sp. NIFS-20-20]
MSASLDWLSPTLKFRLLAKQDLQSGQGFDWLATGNDPYFHLKHGSRQPLGWYMVSVKLRANVAKLGAKLYVDYGDGIEEQHAIQFSLTNNKLFKRLCYFPQRPVRLRFDPCIQPCQFSVEVFSLAKLSEKRARKLMLKKLQNRRNTDPFKQLASAEILCLYNQCFDDGFGLITYSQWLAEYQQRQLQPQQLELISQSLTQQPLISVIMASYNSPIAYLAQCIASVKAQVYPHWQLCIADDASTDPEVLALLQSYVTADERIVICAREQNGHISAASNSALALAEGEYVALLDHDDLLAPHALLMMAQAINRHPQAEFFYSDEDKIDEQGNRSEPHFKSAWNRDLFYSHNYITHLAVIKHSLMTKVGGFRTGVEGSQDYDVFLRAIAHLGNKQIIHVPHVLYHWRAINGSTALSAGEKTYTNKAGLKALTDYFTPINLAVEVTAHQLNNCYRITWPLPEPLPLVSLIIPTRDGIELLKQCIDSIYQRTDYRNFEIIIVDNQSRCRRTLAYMAELTQQGLARVVKFDDEFNFSAINNHGVAHAKGSIVGLINNDIEVLNRDWLTEMVRQVSRPDIGCVGAKLFYPDKRIQHAGVVLGIGGVAGHAHKYFGSHHHGYHSRLSLVQNFSAVTAAALLVRKAVYQEVGGLETRLKVAFNDVDFCLKVREAGYRNLWTPFAELTHHESVSRGYEDSTEKQQRFQSEIDYMQQKWGEQLLNDPCYNPNLTLTHEDFSCRV